MTTFEIRPKIVPNLIVIALTLSLMGITTWAIFFKADDPLELNDLSGKTKACQEPSVTMNKERKVRFMGIFP
jgi:hypothetical protein